jgi:cytochrome c biogenesis protein CcmG/thiol:disulfide interchange protein DsbE
LPSTPSSTERLSRKRRAILVAVSLLVPALVLTVVLRRDDHANATSTTPMTAVAPIDATKARVGSLAPDFALPDLHGNVVRLSQYRGRAVVLTFFASWCHPCEEELPVLEQLQREEGTRLAVVGVNYQDIDTDTRDFVRRLGVTFPALVEPSSDPVAARYGVHGIPVTFFVDARGIVATAPLYGEGSRKALQPGLDALLG